MSKGWIKTHRAVWDHWVFKDSRYFHIWSCLLIKASYKSRTVMTTKGLVKLEVGDLVTSLEEISQVTRNSIQVVRRCLELLAEDQMIIRISNSKGTHITICNYSGYQETQQVDNTKSIGQQTDMSESNTETTHTSTYNYSGCKESQQADNTKSTNEQGCKTTTNKKDNKKDKEVKNLYKNREGVSNDPPHPPPDDHIGTLSLEVKTEPQKKESLRGRFVPPSLEEVHQYFLDKGIPEPLASEEAGDYHERYTESGWRNRDNKKINSWRGVAATWVKNLKQKATSNQTPQQSRPKTTQGDRYNGLSQAEYERMVDMATRPDYNPNQLERSSDDTDPNNIGRIEG